MGHRAIVAYRCPDGRYDLRYSHWGADGLTLRNRIDAETPLADGLVDPAIVAPSVSFERTLTGVLDPRMYEALYLVSAAFAVEAWCVCWLGWSDDRFPKRSGAGERGAIVTVERPAEATALRTWLRATKAVLADVVDVGALSPDTARRYLESRVSSAYDGQQYTYEGRGWEPT